VAALLIGYARVSTDEQDLTAQRDALTGLGVAAERICVDHGLTDTNRDRPGLREALAACRDGGTLWWPSSTDSRAHCRHCWAGFTL
jgi:DNA invertase Pin-like site-specific DNA recombinase